MSIQRLFLGKRAEALEQQLNGNSTPPPLDKWRRGKDIVHIISRDFLAMVSLAEIELLVVLAIAAPLIPPYPKHGEGHSNQVDVGNGRMDIVDRRLEPSSKYWLGTDDLGRDILSRVIYGTRPALIASLIVVTCAVLIGVPLGAVAGYYGRWVDEIIMRITDLFLAFPSLLLAMAIVAFLGPSLLHAVIALVVSWWPWYTRLVRSVTLTLREAYFVEAARSIALPDWVIILRHILPNSLTPVLVQATIDIGTVILATTSLAFLGLGSRPPSADWGLMVKEGRQHIETLWWYSSAPGLAIFVTVLAFNLLGDTLRDVFDPRQYR